MRLGTEVLERHPNRYAVIVGYFIVRASEKELTDIGSGLKKEMDKPNQSDQRYRDFRMTIDRELQ